MDSKTILICDDDPTVRSSLSLVLKRAGYGIATAETPEQARGANPHYNPRTDPDGYELYAFDHRRRGTGAAGESQGAGAGSPGNPDHRMGFDPSGRTGNPGRSVRFHHQAVEQSRTVGIDPYRDPGTGERTAAEAAPKSPFRRDKIIGKSPLLERVLQTVSRIASTHAPVLITGESGTGKELIAEAIHENSERKDRPFIKVNLGGISLSLFESEMFGHKKGAFTVRITTARAVSNWPTAEVSSWTRSATWTWSAR